MTLWRWMNKDPEFAAAYNAWQRDVIATTRARMMALTASAMSAVERAMRNGDGRLALRVLEKMGFAKEPMPGPTDPADVKRGVEIERRQIEATVREALVAVKEREGQLVLSERLADFAVGEGSGGEG